MTKEQLPRSYTLKFQKSDSFKVLSVNESDSNDLLNTVLPCIVNMYNRGFSLITIKQEEKQ